MKRHKLFSVFLVVLLATTYYLLPATTVASVGIISGNLWSSKSTVYVGDTVTFYTAVWNGGEQKIKGTVVFAVNGTQIGTVSFEANPGELRDASTKWLAGEGVASVTATLKNVTAQNTGIAVAPDNSAAGALSFTVRNDPQKELALAEAALSAAQKEVDAPATSSQTFPPTTVAPLGTSLASVLTPVTSALPGPLGLQSDRAAKLFDALSSTTAQKIAADRGRLASKLAAEAKVVAAQEKLDALKNGGATTTETSLLGRLQKYLGSQIASAGGLKDPLTYAKYLGLGILLFLVSHPVILASLLFVVFFFILWKILRRFIRHRHRRRPAFD